MGKPARFTKLDAADTQPRGDAQAEAARALSGVPLVVGAAFFFSVHGCTVRVASDGGFSTIQLSFIVGLVRLCLCALILPFRRRWWPTVLCGGHGLGFAALVALRNVFGCAALVCIFQAYKRLPIGEGTSLVFTGPIWTTLLARVWLGEPITRYSVAAVFLAVLGVGLISTGQAGGAERAGADGVAAATERSLGISLALLGALCLSVVMVSTRKIGERMPAVVSIGWYGAALLSAAVLAGAALGEPLAPTGAPPWLWALVLGSAALSFVAQAFNTMALQRLPAGPVQVLGTLEICFSFLWQTTFLRTPLSVRSALGALTIISCAALAAAQTLLAPRAAPELVEVGGVAASWSDAAAAGGGLRARSRLGRLWAPRGRHEPLQVEPAPDTEEAVGPLARGADEGAEDGRAPPVRHSLAALHKPAGVLPIELRI